MYLPIYMRSDALLFCEAMTDIINSCTECSTGRATGATSNVRIYTESSAKIARLLKVK